MKHIDPNITVMVEYLSDFPDLSGFGNPGLAENISLAMYDQGVDVIMHASGSSGFGVFKAAYEKTTSDNSTHRWLSVLMLISTCQFLLCIVRTC